MSSEFLWAYGRAGGAASLLLLSLVSVLGIAATSGRRFLGLAGTTLNRVHRYLAAGAMAFLAVHIVTLTIDPHAKLSPLDWLVPFKAGQNPVGNGLGTLAFDLLLAAAAAGLLRRFLPERAFRGIHIAAYPALGLGLVHTIVTGSDAGKGWLLLLALGCLAAVLAAAAWRLGPAFHAFSGARRAASAAHPPRRRRVLP